MLLHLVSSNHGDGQLSAEGKLPSSDWNLLLASPDQQLIKHSVNTVLLNVMN